MAIFIKIILCQLVQDQFSWFFKDPFGENNAYAGGNEYHFCSSKAIKNCKLPRIWNIHKEHMKRSRAKVTIEGHGVILQIFLRLKNLDFF